MTDTEEIRVVLNGYVFLKAMGSQEPELYNVLAQNPKVSLVLTKRILDEYRDIAKDQPPLQVLRLFSRAREQFRTTSKRGKPPQNIPGLPRHHSAIVIEACAAGAHYLVTHWQRWHNLSRNLQEEFGLTVVKPVELVRLVERQ